jgi:hypothetical protein
MQGKSHLMIVHCRVLQVTQEGDIDRDRLQVKQQEVCG